MAGAPYLSCSEGRVWFEVEVLEAEAEGTLAVGFAGTNCRINLVGGDATGWAMKHAFDGDSEYHRRANPPPPSPSARLPSRRVSHERCTAAG